MTLRIAVVQCNPTVGDLKANAAQIAHLAQRAYAQGARVVLTPELALTGYPPEDLLLRPAFLRASADALKQLALDLSDLPDLALVVGHPVALSGADAPRLASTQQAVACNAASLLRGGVIEATYCKHELPNYQVFDERRYFAPGDQAVVFEAGGTHFGINICEDAWFPHAPRKARAAGAQVLLVLNASPYHRGKTAEREQVMRQRCLENGMALVASQMVGGQDEIVFDGASFVLDRSGDLVARAPQFTEDLLMVDVAGGEVLRQAPAHVAPLKTDHAEVYAALTLGVRDYLGKNGFPGALIGLSGGADSALVLAIAVDALGADKVRAVMMPSEFTAQMSLDDAAEMARRLGVQYDVLPITPLFDAFRATLAPLLQARPGDTTLENIQARIRGTLLMGLSNNSGRIVLTTGNKSEMAMGYATLYGDMAGGFAVIKDVTKTLVWELARWRNAQAAALGEAEVIPQRIITRAPSAELRPDQTDQDSLPPYDVLDGILQRYMEQDQSADAVIAAGYARADVERVVHLLKLAEYKRRQAPPGIRITHRAFGRDWRYPITSKFRESF
ncbi:NAD+ synthase [Thiomonas bhubaneswarensis]|uniref:NAD+ synthase n=1 Tax=Thiomonas bhubaneswarensis TaxID=339866 RepID=UPI0006E3BF53|nr:NAD+ synthase [Thiomonas bhubaneswarensis]